MKLFIPTTDPGAYLFPVPRLIWILSGFGSSPSRPSFRQRRKKNMEEFAQELKHFISFNESWLVEFHQKTLREDSIGVGHAVDWHEYLYYRIICCFEYSRGF